MARLGILDGAHAMTATFPAPSTQAAYAAALSGAAFADSSDRGRIWMRDRDRAALLHRLSTNHIERLRPGEGTRTVLTTPIGRIIDLLTIHCHDDGLLLVSSPGRGPALTAHLRKNIFFNDRVKLEDATAALGQLTLVGPQAAEALAALGLPGFGLPAHATAAGAWQGAAVWVAAAPDASAGGAGFSLYAPAEALPELAAALRAAGAPELDPATRETLRVEGGQPAFGSELSLEYIPLETGLWDAISFNKGCYVGQEIIARMESRGRLAKQLRGLRFPAGAPAGLALPAKLDVDGKEAGDLTSLAESPRFGTIGLAYVRTAHAAAGTRVGAGGAEAEVVELPFG